VTAAEAPFDQTPLRTVPRFQANGLTAAFHAERGPGPIFGSKRQQRPTFRRNPSQHSVCCPKDGKWHGSITFAGGIQDKFGLPEKCRHVLAYRAEWKNF